jgi:hypothetical protein
MTRASVSARIEAESPLIEHVWLDTRGERVAWLDVGAAGELGIYGNPDAVRRLGRALLTLADCADELATPAAVAVAESGDACT